MNVSISRCGSRAPNKTRLGANRLQLIADLVDGLVPGYPGPVSVHELHGIFEPPVAMHQFAHRGALGAMRSTVDRAVPARLLAEPGVVLHLGRDRAADRAMGADALARLD